jgi:hypothetical protein
MSSEQSNNRILKENNNLCEYITSRNKRCKNKISENNKCTFHNNRINSILNSNVCRKLVFNTCDGYIFIKQEKVDGINKNILKKCGEISTNNINDKKYCDEHCKSYKYEFPQECPICNEEMSYEEEIPLICGHWFHLNCLKKCIKMECPLCRRIFNDDEIKMIHELEILLFTEIKHLDNLTSVINDFQFLIPKKIIYNDQLGKSFVLLIYMEIVKIFNILNLNYNHAMINKILVNVFNNDELLQVSIKVYNMFDKIIENGTVYDFEWKKDINFDQDNEYTLNYDRFHSTLEDMYYSLI